MNTTKILYVLGLLLISGFSATPAYAKPKVVIKHKNYKVRGHSIEEIQQSIHSHGLTAENGETFAANTDYSLFWQFTFHEDNSGCSIGSANTKVIITYTMPMLEDGLNINKATKDQWDTYYNSLKIHENGHAKLGMQAAEEIQWAIINTLPPMQDCLELAKAANSLGESIANKYHNDNIRYDFDTDHGRSQGAFFLATNN
jgi:predicted secreted Zn-dependent protease